jgi:hypothetical protein
MVRVERLGEGDWAVFREIRLRSLLDSPQGFRLDVRRRVLAERTSLA